MKKSRIEKYNKSFLSDNMMGPNSIIILEELLKHVPLESGIRVLDLGCGNGLTSIYLAKEYGVKVYAVDLWVSATENFKRFQEMKVDDLVIPIHENAKPFHLQMIILML